MKAILMTNTGTPDVLFLSEVISPKILQETQIKISMKAAGINPIDTKLRKFGTFYPDRMPAILGCDGAGIVEKTGSKVTRFKEGDEIYFCYDGIGKKTGTYSETMVIDEKFVAKKPTSLSFTEAAAVPLVLLTAWESLYDRVQLQKNQTVLIHAGAGGVGHIAIQLAKLQGAYIITTVSSPEKAQFCKKLGADVTVNYKDHDFVKTVLEVTDNKGVDIVFDTVGGTTFYKSCEATRHYGDIVALLEPPIQNASWKMAKRRNLSVHYELMLTPQLDSLINEQQRQTDILEEGARLIDQGALSIYVNKTFSLKNASLAHSLLEQGGMMGKLVLEIN